MKVIKEYTWRAHPDADKACGRVPNPVPWRHLDKTAASLLHRHCVDCACTNIRPDHIGKLPNSFCEGCVELGDVNHVL